MKSILFVILTLLTFTGCSTGPTKLLVKNCIALGDDLYSCEEIPTKETRSSRNEGY
jgi:uncharacterized lipoprotein YajG